IGMILGLIKPTSGTVKIFDINFLKNSKKILSRMNFESPYVDLPKKLTVKENLLFYSKLYGINDDFEHVLSICESLKISDLLGREFGSLSSGQKTKVGLCKSLINKPELLLLDEPTASLDPETSIIVREFLLNYKKKNNISIIIASHNMSEVEELCERVILLKQGKILHDGSPKNLISINKCSNLEELFIKSSKKC
ncbi:ABC transporter ATP-binding protein, partial [Rickettsiales bacterium]|nr:ABC transporter ATP-binding protein [Rickettsiales bacterium]